VDLVPEQVDRAKSSFPGVSFSVGTAEEFKPEAAPDYVLLSDTLNEAADVQATLENIHAFSHERTRLVITVYNTLWRPLLGLATLLGLKPRRPELNWLSKRDVLNLLGLAGWEVVRFETRVLVPHRLGGLGALVNRLFAPLLPWVCLNLIFVARRTSAPVATAAAAEPTASVRWFRLPGESPFRSLVAMVLFEFVIRCPPCQRPSCLCRRCRALRIGHYSCTQ
jgi:hypothetical protein